MIDAYLNALPDDIAPRILASRTAFVADSNDYARRLAEPGLQRQAEQFQAAGHVITGHTLESHARQLNAHFGDAPAVLASLRADSTLQRVTDITFQVHSIDPPHADILRSIELIADHIAPELRALEQA
jgi:hypothetical protein